MKDQSGPIRKALTIPFEAEMLEQFAAFCEKSGVSMAGLIRSFIGLAIADGLPGEFVPVSDHGEPLVDEYGHQVFEVRDQEGTITLARKRNRCYDDVALPYLILSVSGHAVANVDSLGWVNVGPTFGVLRAIEDRGPTLM